MSSIATLNGVQYIVPAYNDTGWAQGAGNLSLYLAAIAAGTLQPTGGSFTLTADVDFGANFGLKALFLKSETANPASAGVIRLASADTIKWRNNANGADVSLSKDSSDNLLWATNKVYTAGGAAGIVNADIASGAAIAYSKLALTGSIVNADIGASAAIAYSKLALTGSIVNADINASAAIAYSKLALTGAILNADLAGSIAYSKLTLTGSIVNADLTAGTLTNTAINTSAAIALTKLAAMAGHSKALASDASGFIVESAVTATELGYVSGVTSAIQTQINGISSHLFQIVAATNSTGNGATGGTSLVASNLTASITPASSSHKVLVQVSGAMRITTTVVGHKAVATIKRGSTDLSGGAGLAIVTAPVGSSTDVTVPVSMVFLDSPAATTSTTYTVYFSNPDSSSDAATWEPQNMMGSIVLTEVV